MIEPTTCPGDFSGRRPSLGFRGVGRHGSLFPKDAFSFPHGVAGSLPPVIPHFSK